METRAQVGAVPRTLIVLLTLGLLIALAAGAIVVGSESAAQASNGLIAFVHQGDIYTAGPDGSDRRVIVEGPGQLAWPSWSPDGTRLAYWSREGGSSQLMVIDPDGSAPLKVAADMFDITGWETAAWSPDGSSLAFSATKEVGQDGCPSAGQGDNFCSSRIFVSAADGSTGAVEVGDPALDARTAAWSPDGSTIAFSGGDSKTGISLYLMDSDGMNIRPVGDVMGFGWGLMRLGWSPDGTHIVGTAGDPDWDIWVFAADGGGASKISAMPAAAEITVDQLFPAYAPDGAIAWSRGGEQPACGCLVLLEPGGDAVELAIPGDPPVWAPDGRLIAQATNTNISVIDRTGVVMATIEAVGSEGNIPSWQQVSE